jgi:hypothetical protein
VVSTASEVLSPDGTFTPTSSLSIGDITVPGLALTLPTTTPTAVGIPDPIPGIPQLPRLTFPAIPIPLGGTTIMAPHIGLDDGQFTITVPFLGKPQVFALPAQTVLNFFKAAGINMTYEAAQTTPDSVVSPALTISTVLPSPPANDYFNGSTPVNIAIGYSSASIQGSVLPAPVSTDDGSGVVGTSGNTGNTGASTFPSSSPGFSSSFPSTGGSTTGSGSSATNSGTSTSPLASSSFEAVSNRTKLGSLFDLYFVLIAAAVVGIWAATFLRYLGVRTKWKS